MSIHSVSCAVGANPITIETGKIARLADGAVTVRCGDTVVLVTVVSATKIKDGQTFFPLSVEYKEKAAAAGMFPGGYFKREGRPTEKEILTCRMTDRPLRPMFPKGYFYDTQVISLLMAADGENEPDILSINGASAACVISDLPFAEPVGAVRVGRINGEFVINPTNSQRTESDLDLVYAGSKDQVIMIEGSANELPEEDFIAALRFAQENVAKICAAQEELRGMCGKPTREYELTLAKPELLEIGYQVAGDRIEDAIYAPNKIQRQKQVGALRDEVEAKIKETYPEATDFDVEQVFEYIQKKAFRISIMEQGKRADGRAIKQLRPLSAEVNVLPPVVHGSALFSRGETMSMCLATLARMEEKQYLDNYTGSVDEKRFILHYNFPPFTVGETGRFGGQNRREIGHGALAERALVPMLPDESEFPYAMRLVSEVVSSNGSTSQASICASTLALMDAGVPLKKPVAGVAMGLIKDDTTGNIAVLTDIQGLEDFLGDMDFKVAGTREGITAIQMDIKIKGINEEILTRALEQARRGRLFILDKMAETIAAPREEMSPYAPRIMQFSIHPDKIREVIGSGGKTINGIIAATGVKIDLEDDGRVFIASPDAEAAAAAKRMIDDICRDIEVGGVFLGKVVNILPIGAQVELKPGKKGLVHISRLANYRVEKVEDEVQIGDEILVRVIAIKPDGKIDLTRKELLPDAKK